MLEREKEGNDKYRFVGGPYAPCMAEVEEVTDSPGDESELCSVTRKDGVVEYLDFGFSMVEGNKALLEQIENFLINKFNDSKLWKCEQALKNFDWKVKRYELQAISCQIVVLHLLMTINDKKMIQKLELVLLDYETVEMKARKARELLSGRNPDLNIHPDRAFSNAHWKHDWECYKQDLEDDRKIWMWSRKWKVRRVVAKIGYSPEIRMWALKFGIIH